MTVAAAGLILGGCSHHRADSSTAAFASTAGGKVVARGVTGGFDLIVGHSYHAIEASLNQADAAAMIAAREGQSGAENAQDRINEIFSHDDYRRFGGADEDQPPLCRVDDQDQVDVDTSDDGGLNALQPSSPVSCTTEHGSTLYVTIWNE